MGYPKTVYVQHVTAEFFGRAWEERPAGYSVRYDMHDDEAQDKIASLKAENERLREALRTAIATILNAVVKGELK